MDIPCYYATETKKTNQITEYGNKAPPLKGHRRVDTKCIERYIKRNHPKVIQILYIDNCTIWGWSNSFVATLGDIAEVTHTEMLIDEDEKRETKKLMYYLRFSYQKNAAKSKLNLISPQSRIAPPLV